MAEPTIDYEEAAEIIGICSKTLRKLRSAGKIRYVQVTEKKVRFRECDVIEFLEANSKQEAAPCSTKGKTRRTGIMTSPSRVVDFTARRDAQAKKKR